MIAVNNEVSSRLQQRENQYCASAKPTGISQAHSVAGCVAVHARNNNSAVSAESLMQEGTVAAGEINIPKIVVLCTQPNHSKREYLYMLNTDSISVSAKKPSALTAGMESNQQTPGGKFERRIVQHMKQQGSFGNKTQVELSSNNQAPTVEVLWGMSFLWIEKHIPLQE